MRKKFRFLTVLAVCVMVLSCFSVTAFAYADDTEQNLPVTEATQPEQQPAVTPTPEKLKGEPIDDEGNAYTRDLLYDKATNKQFITIQTKNGNTFYIVIDYDAPINEDEEQYQTYFLNMVDESDLLAVDEPGDRVDILDQLLRVAEGDAVDPLQGVGLPVVADDAEGAVDMAVAERLTGDGRSVQAELL